ncbi:hypothetical protein LTR37_019920 [Vermiconidia calcicola]|uniref:Uncharacterized protein n=1 Tax=Vermiconidia calcicola TaxID=1690605 RepID=A0ACC3MEQ4_9PEZI|nr:hypothetical protein LTR37_019920 [Vermiconidia calcicola]
MAQILKQGDSELQSPTEENINSFSDEPPLPYIQRIPPEIRNRIYELVLGHGESVDIDTTGWPGIVDTCQKIREEALPLYLSNIFVVTILDFNHVALCTWLEGFKLVPAELKNWSKRFASYQRLLQTSSTGYSIIERISVAGLVATQLGFPGVLQYDKDMADRRGSRGFFIGTQKYLLNTDVLTPLLRARNLLDAKRPPVDVFDQLKCDYKVLQLKPRHYLLVSDEILHCTIDTPKEWFALWQSRVDRKLQDVKYG